MRICSVAYTYYEVDNRVMRYAEALAERGDHIDVLAVAKPGLKKFEIINGVHVYRVQTREINEKGKFDYLFKLLFFLWNTFWILTWRTFRRRYDVIHIHSIPDFEVFAALIARLMGTRVILDIHDLVPEFFNSKFGKSEKSMFYKMLLWEEKLSMAFADHVIIANHLWEKTLYSRSLKPEKCSVYLNYPDPGIFRYRETPKPADEFRISFPGTLSWHQGVDILVRAMKLIRESHPECKLYVYGVGSERCKLIELAKDLKINDDTVFFKDILPIQDIANVMSSCHMGVVPKRKDSFGNEAFSTKIFEFMSLGVPVLVSDTKIDTYYFNEDCVKFFTSGDEQELAEKLVYLIEHEDERNRLAKNSLEFIQQHNWDIHQGRYFELVDTLAKHQQLAPQLTGVK